MQEAMDNIVPTRGYDLLPTVGPGGSAGSIRALQRFFEHLPAHTGMAFVVILHHSPEHESTLAELLGRSTPMPVRQAANGDKLEADHVYVIPPGKHLTCTDGHLKLTDLQAERGKRVAVDLFFRTLADTHGPHATAVVFSGADGDGALGIKRIKERGGLTIVQDPDEAEHPSMPRTSIATGMVDWILETAEMPGRLIEFIAMLLAEHAGRMDSPPSLQVFATDLDEEVFTAARGGAYPLASVANVSEVLAGLPG